MNSNFTWGSPSQERGMFHARKLGFAPRKKGNAPPTRSWILYGNVREFGDAEGSFGKRCLFFLTAFYPGIRLSADRDKLWVKHLAYVYIKPNRENLTFSWNQTETRPKGMNERKPNPCAGSMTNEASFWLLHVNIRYSIKFRLLFSGTCVKTCNMAPEQQVQPCELPFTDTCISSLH